MGDVVPILFVIVAIGLFIGLGVMKARRPGPVDRSSLAAWAGMAIGAVLAVLLLSLL